MFRAEEDVLSGGPDINEPFVTLEPAADGNYQVTEDPSDGLTGRRQTRQAGVRTIAWSSSSTPGRSVRPGTAAKFHR